MHRRERMGRAGILLVCLALAGAACEETSELTLPTADEVAGRYEYRGRLQAAVTGNVAVLTVEQEAAQLRRGGSLWAKVGPYIFLFSDETRGLFDEFGGLAGVRVTTEVGDAVVATALLTRDELSDVLWRRSLNIAGRARRDGTHRVPLLEDLTEWGEDHTEFEYNPRYTRRR